MKYDCLLLRMEKKDNLYALTWKIYEIMTVKIFNYHRNFLIVNLLIICAHCYKDSLQVLHFIYTYKFTHTLLTFVHVNKRLILIYLYIEKYICENFSNKTWWWKEKWKKLCNVVTFNILYRGYKITFIRW